MQLFPITSYFSHHCRMQRFGMNTYLYAPKDDYKHRLEWRELYTEQECGNYPYCLFLVFECYLLFIIFVQGV